MAISFRLAWQSLFHGADAPPSSWQEDGIAPGRLPNLLLNWLLVGLTEVVDGYLGDLSKKYEHKRLISEGLPRGIFSLRQVLAPWSIVHQKIDFGNENPNKQAAEDSGVVVYYLDTLPRGARITRVKTILLPTSGHSGLPTTMPKMRLVAYQRSDFTAVQTVLQTDASANVAAYEVLHTIDSGDLTSSFSAIKPAEDHRVVVEFFGESGTAGTTFFSGLQVYGVEVTYQLALADLVQSAVVIP